MSPDFGDYGYDYDDNSSGYNDSSSIIYLDTEESQFFRVFSTICYSVIFCLSLPGNTFLLWVLLRKRELRTTADFLLLQLTASDLCFTLTLPFWAYYHLHGWLFGDWACKIISGAFFLGLFSYMAFLTAMTVDRYVAVVHALSVSAQGRRRSYALWASIGIWLLCAAISLIEAVNSEARDDGFDGVDCVQVQLPLAMQLFGYYLQIGLFFLLPFIIITFCYLCMWVTISQCRLRGRNQAVRLILGIVVGFFICWAPYNIILFLESLMMLGVQSLSTATWSEAMHYGYYISHSLAYCHCCLNPLFHVFGGDRFKKHLPLPYITSRSERIQTFSSLTSTQRNPLSQQTHL